MFSRTSRGIARYRHTAAVSVMVTTFLAVALLVSAHGAAHAGESSRGIAETRHACTVDMGLDSWGRDYDTCVSSLEKSLARVDRAQRVESERSACAAKGLDPDTPAFAVCVVTTGQSPPKTQN
jgi:hypothetical protein